ncbi:putative site-specific integrase-resolvase [Microbacterium testaceum]|uniref:helix-turn-helix domain-containing protein n=1 Tax=Microbacterium testaceum TaxID=2033 RepID=UPI0027874A22|nr:helix-turn-helix domain-containing protein [Microbacterium testaceum]MDQ1174211.1 putative site-specific integrase-resolvase [Microbacterium testaceum]
MSTAPVIPLRPAAQPDSPLVWMTEQEVSEHLKVSIHTLRDWRRKDAVKVLPFHELGRLIRYERGEIDAAMRAGRVEVTS